MDGRQVGTLKDIIIQATSGRKLFREPEEGTYSGNQRKNDIQGSQWKEGSHIGDNNYSRNQRKEDNQTRRE